MTELDEHSGHADEEAAWPSYVYKPTLVGAAWEFALRPNGLFWRYGRYSGVVPYESITRVRLSFRPVTTQTYRFIAEIWAPKAPKLPIASSSWRSITTQARQDADYNAFLAELHRRLAAAGSKARFETGMHPFIYWTGVFVFGGIGLGLVGLIAHALRIGESSGALLVSVFLAVFIWQIGNLMRHNRPGLYQPEAVPASALPRV